MPYCEFGRVLQGWLCLEHLYSTGEGSQEVLTMKLRSGWGHKLSEDDSLDAAHASKATQGCN